MGAWLIAEDRDRVFAGSTEVDNPLQERTRVKVPLLTLDAELVNGSLVPLSRLQRGTGTVDPLFGANLGRRFGTGLTVFASVAARLPFYENGDGLKTGASPETNVGMARELGHHRPRVLTAF